jgi:hypothetical protein
MMNSTEELLRSVNRISNSDKCLYRITFNGTLFVVDHFSSSYCAVGPSFK